MENMLMCCCSKFHSLCPSLNRRASIHILRKISVVYMRLPLLNFHATPKRYLIKIRTFPKKNDSYLEKYMFGLRLKNLNFFKCLTAIKHLTNFLGHFAICVYKRHMRKRYKSRRSSFDLLLEL